MSERVASGADDVAAADTESSDEVLLWRAPWFRVLTIVNCAIVVTSAVGALLVSESLNSGWSGPWGWAYIWFPVVPALFGAPEMWFTVLGLACLLSLLNLLGPGDKGARFLRALTVWGTIVLVAPILFGGFLWLGSVARTWG